MGAILQVGLNVSGIILQIIGFVLLLFAIKQMPLGGGSFTNPVSHLRNVMSNISPRLNMIGIGLVILGLLLQLVAALLV